MGWEKVFEAEHRSRQPLDESMVLLNDIVKVFPLTNLDAFLHRSVHLFCHCITPQASQ